MDYIGIDPGMTGAFAIISDDGINIVVDTPILQVGSGKKIRREYNVRGMADMLKTYTGEAIIGIESVHSMPDQGVASSFNFGKGFGIWLGIIGMRHFPYHLIPPQRWKKTMLDGMGKEKDASRLRAIQLFPHVSLALKKHHGRAEALLIAYYTKTVIDKA